MTDNLPRWAQKKSFQFLVHEDKLTAFMTATTIRGVTQSEYNASLVPHYYWYKCCIFRERLVVFFTGLALALDQESHRYIYLIVDPIDGSAGTRESPRATALMSVRDCLADLTIGMATPHKDLIFRSSNNEITVIE